MIAPVTGPGAAVVQEVKKNFFAYKQCQSVFKMFSKCQSVQNIFKVFQSVKGFKIFSKCFQSLEFPVPSPVPGS